MIQVGKVWGGPTRPTGDDVDGGGGSNGVPLTFEANFESLTKHHKLFDVFQSRSNSKVMKNQLVVEVIQ